MTRLKRTYLSFGIGND